MSIKDTSSTSREEEGQTYVWAGPRKTVPHMAQREYTHYYASATIAAWVQLAVLNPMKFKVRLAGVSTPQTDSKQSHDIAMGLKIERQNLRGP